MRHIIRRLFLLVDLGNTKSFADGTVTGTFSSLSPVAFVVDKTTLTSATGTATSPATSATAVSAVAVLGLAAIAVAFGLKKKAVR